MSDMEGIFEQEIEEEKVECEGFEVEGLSQRHHDYSDQDDQCGHHERNCHEYHKHNKNKGCGNNFLIILILFILICQWN
ncbi:hypothetical protein RDV78_07470 [Bacillota bacterium LX-D]|nr:hypothetical protein [Bacillota bacterium LX-D]